MAVKLVLLIVLLSFRCLPIAAQNAAPLIEGKYGRMGSSDSLEISRQPSGTFTVKLRLYYDSGHTCSLDSDAATWTRERLVLTAPGIRDDEPCVLEFTFRKGQVKLADYQLRCTPVYCGTRGTFYGVTLFQKGPK